MKKTILSLVCLLVAPLAFAQTGSTNSLTSRTINSIARTMLSLLCASLFVLSLSGCADTEEYYADTHSTPEYRYNHYYDGDYYMYPWYGYYGGAYYSPH